MLEPIRKFSSSIFGKIFLAIIAIPFIFWGMGSVFQGGKKNIIVEIGKEKVSVQEFLDFVRFNSPNEDLFNKDLIQKLLYNYIGQKVVVLESKNLDFRTSDYALSKVIKNEKIFKKENKFSRTEYEKFLIKNSLTAVTFEANISEQIKKEQLFTFIGGGVVPSKFLINIAYDKMNQKRSVQFINLDEIFKKKMNFSNEKIVSFYEKNKESYNDIYKSIKFVRLNLQNLTGSDDYDSLFFEKIDEIDDLIVEGKNLNFIIKKFNLGNFNLLNFNKSGKNKDAKDIDNFPNKLIQNVFNISENEPTILIENEQEYFIIQLIKTEKIQKKVSEDSVKKDILSKLKKEIKRKSITEIISRINENNFDKIDFDKLSKDENVIIKKIKLESQNDNKILKKEIVEQIYAFSKNKVVVVADIALTESYLIYIDKIENKFIDENSDDYKKYFELSKAKMVNNINYTYDSYLNSKYKIKINYNALDNIQNYFR